VGIDDLVPDPEAIRTARPSDGATAPAVAADVPTSSHHDRHNQHQLAVGQRVLANDWPANDWETESAVNRLGYFPGTSLHA
jgi:hypothetical protein